jgi:hypothetical protein
MLTKRQEQSLHQIAQACKSPEDFKNAFRILVAHNPRVREQKRLRNLRNKTAQVATYRAMNLDERSDYITKRQASYGSKRKQEIEENKQLRRERLHRFMSLRDVAVGSNLTPLFFHYHVWIRRIDHQTNTVSEHKRLIATSCVLVDKENRPIAKGSTIVSPRENPNKIEGRIIALDRALDAYQGEWTSMPIRRAEARWVGTALPEFNTPHSAAWSNHIIYTPDAGELTELEINRIDARRERLQENVA